LETIKLSTRIIAKVKTRVTVQVGKHSIWQQVQIYQTSNQVHNNVNEWNTVAGDAIQRTFQLL